MMRDLTWAEKVKNVTSELEDSEEILRDLLSEIRKELKLEDGKLVARATLLWDAQDQVLEDRRALESTTRERRIHDLEIESGLGWSLLKALEEQARREAGSSGLASGSTELTLRKARDREMRTEEELFELKSVVDEEEEACLRKALAEAKIELAKLRESGDSSTAPPKIPAAEEELRLREEELAEFLGEE
jgi:hypothetical protein